MTARVMSAGRAVRAWQAAWVMALLVAATWAQAFDLQGHRGARWHRPENTLAAFELAIAQGATTLETDIAITRDGVLVLHHALWKGLIADEANEDDETLIIRESLQAVQEMDDFTATLLPVGDGLLVAVKA